MFELGKRLASLLPQQAQQELHRWLCIAKIKAGRFTHYEAEYLRLAEWVSEGDFVLDIGANLGIFSSRLSELVGENGHVFAFEPVPRTFRLLSSNANFFKHDNVTLLNVAASNNTGTVNLDIPNFSSGLPAFTRAGITESYDPANGVAKSQVAAYSILIDSLEIPHRISFVKIDVEGHELQVLQGMEKLLRRDRPTLVIEGNNRPVVDYLASIGYLQTITDGSPNSVFSIDG